MTFKEQEYGWQICVRFIATLPCVQLQSQINCCAVINHLPSYHPLLTAFLLPPAVKNHFDILRKSQRKALDSVQQSAEVFLKAI